jgi:iron complex outermembrane receptor protein
MHVLLAAMLIATSLPGTLARAAESSKPEGTGAEEAGGLQEIIVTATKRNENLVKVPISMNVFTDSAITAAGIMQPVDFLAATPNVTFIQDNAGEAYINIRGQTSVRNSDPNVAIVIDGVTLSSTKPFNQDLFDIQQIEVLKGPQSALYGRNAAAGAIVITTKQPTDVWEGDVVAGRGNFNTTRTSGSVSGPLTDTLKISLAGSFRNTDGPFTNVTTGEKVERIESTTGRMQLRYQPDNQLTVDLRVSGHTATGGSTAYNAQVVGLPLGGFPGTALDANNTNIPFVSNVIGQGEDRFSDALLKIDYDFGFARLTSITAANYLNQYFGSDSPPYLPNTGSPGATVQQYTYVDTNYSEELRLTSRSDQRVRWQVGFYALEFLRNQTSKISVDNMGSLPADNNHIAPPGAIDPTLSYDDAKYKTTSYAPFASVQIDILDQLHLNVAGRYDTEKRTIREVAADEINPLTGLSYNNCVALTGKSLGQCTNSHTFKQFEPKVSLSYDLAANASVYASYGKGFKSGGFNPIGSRQALIGAAIAAGIPASSVFVQDNYDKEVSTAYEIGAKGRFFDRKLNINVAAFKTDITGAQQFEFYPSVGLQTTISIDKVKLKGFDADFDAALPMGVTVFGGYGYTDGQVASFAGNPRYDGNVAPGAFKYTINLGVSQSSPITNELSIVPRVEVDRYGPIWWDVANTPGTRRDPLTLLNARLTLKSTKKWELAAYGDNLTNRQYYQEVVPLLGGFSVNYRGSTRTYGMEVRYSF